MAVPQLPKLVAWVRFPSPAPRRSKVRFAPTSFYARGKKDVIRPLPCSSFPTATRYAGLAVGGPPCGRHFSPLRNIDFNRPFQKERHAAGVSFFLGSAAQREAPPFDLKCSGQVNCPCAKVLACGQNACTAQTRPGRKAGRVALFLRIRFITRISKYRF